MAQFTAASGEILLEGKGLSKQFPGVRALHKVDVQCRRGRVLALVGENGAGKSTLCNLLGGILQPDGGQILVEGRPVRIRSPQHARSLGIGFVHQELSLFPQLTVGENIMLGHEPRRRGLISQKELHARAAEILRQISSEIDVDEMTYRLPPARLQMVEIAKAWSRHPSVLILDEPTSSLSSAEVEMLFGMLSRFKEAGTSIIFISHRLDEVFRVADDIMVMKDGEVVAVRPAGELTRDDLIRLMVGRQMTQAFPPRPDREPGQPLLDLRNISVRGRVFGVDMVVRAGEIVGLGGLDGQGQRELVRAVFGLVPFTGEMEVLGKRVHPRSPAEAIRAGIAFIPDDRKGEGLVLPLSVAHNMVLSILGSITRLGIVNRREEEERVERYRKALGVNAPSMDARVRTLSGGNQQKVVFAKWLMTEPRVLVMHEPTRGIDVETKMQIYELVRDLANKGHAVLLLSSDMLELLGLCDRIYVMYEGRLAGELPGAEATEEKLMALSSGSKAVTV